MNKLLTFLFLLLIQQVCRSQPYVDIGSVYGMKGNDNFLPEDQSDMAPSHGGMHVTLPFQMKDSSVWVITALYERWRLEFPAGDENFQTALLPVTWLKPLHPDWKISFTFIPRFNNSVRIIETKDMQYGGAVIVTHAFSNKLKLKGGLYYNKEFFGNYFLPLAGIEWAVTGNVVIFGLLPNSLTADFTVSDRVHAGINYKGITTSFRLDEDKFYDYYAMEEGQVSAYADLYLAKNIVLNLQIGHTALRNYGYGFSGEDYIKQDLNDGFIYKAGLLYRLWLNK